MRSKSRRLPWWAVMLLCTLTPLSAQTQPSDDEQIDTLLATPRITWQQASWLVGHAFDTVDEPATPDAEVRLADYAWLLYRALDVPGGVMVSLFPGPRYAFRELVYRRILPSDEAPDAFLTGQEALMYLQNAQSWKEGRS